MSKYTFMQPDRVCRLETSNLRRVTIVRALPGLGDMLCAIPALRALRSALPDAHISLIGLPAVAELIARFGQYVDELLPFPGYPGIPERPAVVGELLDFLAEVHRWPFDLAIQMHGSGIVSNPFTLLLGAKVAAGFYLPGQYCPDPDHFLLYPANEPEVRRYLRLMAFLGLPPRGEELEFPVLPADRAALAALPAMQKLAGYEYVCIHPGAANPARRWPPQHFAAVADGLAGRGLKVVLTGSTGEAALTAAVGAAMRSPVIDLTGQTNLGTLAALLSDARLLVCNDTGVSHLAAALRTPSVIVFVASDPQRWAPLDSARHRPLGRSAGEEEQTDCACSIGQRCLSDGCRLIGNHSDGHWFGPAVADALMASRELLSTSRSPEHGLVA